MTSKRMLRGWWIVAAGACIALSAGNGIAAADSDSTDGGAASSSSQSSHSSSSSTSGASAVSKGADNGQDSADGPKSVNKPTSTVSASTVTVDKPTSTVSASTVTVDRDETATSEPVKSVPTKPSKRADATTPIVHPKVQAEAAPAPVAAPEAEHAVEPAPANSSVEDVAIVNEAAPVIVPSPAPADAVEIPSAGGAPVVGATSPQKKSIDGNTKPAVVTAMAAVAADPAPATEVVQGVAAIRSLAAPVVRAPPAGPLVSLFLNVLSAFGLVPPGPAIPAVITPGGSSTPSTNVVTGVQVGHASVQIPVGSGTYTGAADWYFPTQADGTVQAQGVMWLQHGFLGDKSWYSALAQQLARQTNSVVVVPNIPSFPFFTCNGCTLSGVPIQQGVAALFEDPTRAALNASATAAGFQGILPEKFTLTGHSAGGGLAAAAGGFYAAQARASGTENDLLGVVMFDGVSSNGTFADAVGSLDASNIPIYQIAAPPQSWNANGQTTKDLVALHPDQFVGDVLANGSHVDSLIGGVPLIDFISQLVIKRSPPGNTDAVYTLATGWINDFYAGRGPADPLYGTYGDPNQYIVLGPTAAVVLGPPPVVDVNRYLGTWYEVGSVKQFFSIGLVNTTAVYSLNPDGSIKVVNSGNYFFDNGPKSTIVGTALPVDPADPANAKLNVTFFGAPSAAPPGNYWIVGLAPDYSWAVVSDPTGNTGFLLSRTRTVSDALYQELLNRASVEGVKGWITRTRQPAAQLDPVTV